jgi:hypothetical protein
MGMPRDSEHIDEGGLSRRQVLARGAVAAGVVWAAPVIRTATAYATSSAGTERPCINFYLVAVDPLGIRPVRFSPTSRFGYDDLPDSAAAALAAATTTTTSSTTTSSTSSTTTTTKPPAPKAGQPRASRHATTTTTSTTTTTTTTKPPLHAPDGDETASKVAPSPTTKPPRPAAQPTPTTSTTRPPARPSTPSRAGGGAPVDDFGLFDDASAIDLTSPAATVPTDPADPHAVLFAAAAANAQAGTPDALPPGIKAWLEDNPDVPVRYPTTLPMVTQTGDDAWAIMLARVDGPDPLTHQCRVVNGWAGSKGKHAEFFVDPNPASADEAGRRVIFPNPRADDLVSDPSALIESVIFVFCCPQ